MALTVESAELLEIFQWLTPEKSFAIEANRKFQRVRQAIADIVVYAISLCALLKIDLPEAIKDKLELNKMKYPVMDKAAF